MPKLDKFTLGCDPELICRMDGKPVAANRFFKSNSSFGLDGNSYTAELRPGFDESPIDMTAKIYQILEYGHSKNKNVELYSGHYVDDHCIGGHIHFGLKYNDELLKNIDAILFAFSDCIDDLEQRKQRMSGGHYGKRRAYREKGYGGFEYRTPGSWLLSPAITNAVFSLSKLTVVNYYEKNKNFVRLYDETIDKNQGKKQDQISYAFIKSLKEHFEIIPEDCSVGLEHAIILLDKKIDWNSNIIKNWGIE